MMPLAARATGDPVLINEVLASTTGTDVEYFELYGNVGASLAGLSFIGIEGNDVAGPGTIDFQWDFGSEMLSARTASISSVPPPVWRVSTA